MILLTIRPIERQLRKEQETDRSDDGAMIGWSDKMMSSVIRNDGYVYPSIPGSLSLVQVKVKRVTVSIHPQRRSVIDHVNGRH